MSYSTAHLRNLRQSPRKVRLLANAVKGKKVDQAVEMLKFIPKRAAGPIQKLIESAQNNARNKQLNGDLYISSITVNEGSTLFRGRPAARGQMKPIRKRTSHVSVVLKEQEQRRGKSDKTQTSTEESVVEKQKTAA